MSNQNITPAAFRATVSEKQKSEHFSPREHVIENIYNALIRAHEPEGIRDAYDDALALLDFIEKRAIHRGADGVLYYVNPDHQVDFLESN